MCAGINPYSRYRKILRITFRKNTCANGCHIIGGSELSCKNFMLTTMKRVLLTAEAFVRRCPSIKAFLKIYQISQKNVCVGVSYTWFPPQQWHSSYWVTKFGRLRFIVQSLSPEHFHYLHIFSSKLIVLNKKILLVLVISVKLLLLSVTAWSKKVKNEEKLSFI